MSIFKFAILGAAVAYGIHYITRQREDGTSIMDDLSEQAPEWMEKAKQFASQTVDDVKDTIVNSGSYKNYDQTS